MALRVASYADDTAIYLNNPTEINAALKIKHVFGEVFGLRLNGEKDNCYCTTGGRYYLWAWPATL